MCLSGSVGLPLFSICKVREFAANVQVFCEFFRVEARFFTALSFKNAERIRKSCYFIALTNGLEIDV